MKLMPKLNPNGWDEMFSTKGVRNSYRNVLHTLQSLSPENLGSKTKTSSGLVYESRALLLQFIVTIIKVLKEFSLLILSQELLLKKIGMR